MLAVGRCSPLTIEREDDLAVGTRLELIRCGVAPSDVPMVVDFSIHGQYLTAVGRVQRLLSALRVDDGEALVGKNGRAATIDSTPVGSAMTDFLTHSQCFLSQIRSLLLDVENTNYSTHSLFCLNVNSIILRYQPIFLNTDPTPAPPLRWEGSPVATPLLSTPLHIGRGRGWVSFPLRG